MRPNVPRDQFTALLDILSEHGYSGVNSSSDAGCQFKRAELCGGPGTISKDKIIIKNCGSGDHKIGNYNINISQVDTINIPISQIQMHTLLSGDFNYDICTDCSINIETGRNMKLFGCTDITAKGFPIIVKNPKNKLSKKIFYRITYKISV